MAYINQIKVGGTTYDLATTNAKYKVYYDAGLALADPVLLGEYDGADEVSLTFSYKLVSAGHLGIIGNISSAWINLINHYTSKFSVYAGNSVVATFNQSAANSVKFLAGDNVTLTGNSTSKTITISAADTHYTSTFSVYAGDTAVATFNQSANNSVKFLAGDNITLTPNTTNKTITISASGGGASYSYYFENSMGAMIVLPPNIMLSAGNSVTIIGNGFSSGSNANPAYIVVGSGQSGFNTIELCSPSDGHIYADAYQMYAYASNQIDLYAANHLGLTGYNNVGIYQYATSGSMSLRAYGDMHLSASKSLYAAGSGIRMQDYKQGAYVQAGWYGATGTSSKNLYLQTGSGGSGIGILRGLPINNYPILTCRVSAYNTAAFVFSCPYSDYSVGFTNVGNICKALYDAGCTSNTKMLPATGAVGLNNIYGIFISGNYSTSKTLWYATISLNSTPRPQFIYYSITQSNTSTYYAQYNNVATGWTYTYVNYGTLPVQVQGYMYDMPS